MLATRHRVARFKFGGARVASEGRVSARAAPPILCGASAEALLAETPFTPLGAILLLPALESLRTSIPGHVEPLTAEGLRTLLEARAVFQKANPNDRLIASLQMESSSNVVLDPGLVEAAATMREWKRREERVVAERETAQYRFRRAADAGQITAYIKSWNTGYEIPIGAKQWGMDSFARHAFISGNGWAWINGIKVEGHIFLWEADLKTSLLGSRPIEGGVRVQPPSLATEPAGGKRGGRPSLQRDESKKALIALGFPEREVAPAAVQAELKRGCKLGLYQVEFVSADTIARAKEEFDANHA